MKFLRFLARGIVRLVTGLLLFFTVGVAYGVLLYVLAPWSDAEPGSWPGRWPIAVTSHDPGTTRVIPYQSLADAMKTDPTLVPWPGTATGTGQEGRAQTAWKTVGGKAWQFEVSWDDRDYVLQSRYRLEGERAVLVQTRGRSPAIAFQSIVLTVVTLIAWKLLAWWRRRRAARSEIGE